MTKGRMLDRLAEWIQKYVFATINAWFSLPRLVTPFSFEPARKRALSLTHLVCGHLKMPVLFTDRLGLRYLLYPGEDIFYRFLYNGDPETIEQEYLSKTIRSGMVLFDVGANIGVFSLLFCRLAGDGNVHSFEPVGFVYARLVENLRVNGYETDRANRLLVHCESRGLFPIHVFSEGMSELSTIGNPQLEVDGRPIRPERVEEVDTISLDAYCAQKGIEQIDLLKVDVEGAEMHVFQGSRRLLGEGRIHRILFEVSAVMVQGLAINPDSVFELLQGFGYALYRLEKDLSLTPLDRHPGSIKENFLAVARGIDPEGNAIRS